MWILGLLITFWVFELLVVIVAWFFGSASAYLAHSVAEEDNSSLSGYSYYDEYSDYERRIGHAYAAGACVWLIFATISCALTIAEIVLVSRKRLGPKFAVISNTIKVLLWLILFLISFSSAVTIGSVYAGVIILAIFLVIHLAPLIYVSVIYGRFRKGRINDGVVYEPAVNNPDSLPQNMPEYHYQHPEVTAVPQIPSVHVTAATARSRPQ